MMNASTMWIGVVSDTGGALVSAISDALRGVDYIVHCGGIGGTEMLDQLSSIAKVTGVLSPGDDPKSYPFERMLFRRWAGVSLVAFGRNVDPADVPSSLAAEIDRRAARVVLFGGRQDAVSSNIGGRLYFCPGSANPRRRRDLPSVGLIELSGSRVRAEVVTVER